MSEPHGAAFLYYVELYKRGLISLEKIAEKMCHNVAVLYGIEKRIHS
jgi:dihydroorotase